MKKNILFGMLLLIATFVSAQKWNSVGSKWNYGYSLFSVEGYNVLKIGNDAFVNGFSCKTITGFDREYDYNSPSSPTTTSSPYNIYTYISNDTVYFFRNGQFRPYYYFNAKVGDTISYYTELPCYSPDTQILAVVDTVKNVIISGQNLKYFHARFIPRTQLIIPLDISYMEKVGATNNFLLPSFSCNFDAKPYISFCNFIDSSFNGVAMYPSHKCEYNLGIDDVNNIEVLKLYPNPTNNVLEIETSITDFTVKIYDLTGMEIYCPSSDKQVNVSMLSSGIYLLSLRNQKGSLFMKFIKE
jgi:hypothetical protein